MALKELARMVFVARERVEPRTSREVAVHVSIIAEVSVGYAAGRNLAFWIQHRLILVIFINIRPPGLGMPEKGSAGIFLEHLVKAIKTSVAN